MLKLTDNQLNPNGYWDKPIDNPLYVPSIDDVDLFDQNGYDLTYLEQGYAIINDMRPVLHRQHRSAIKQPWFVQDSKKQGAVLNHSLLFERKGYKGAALEQLKQWAKDLPLIHKVIAIRPKWGLDFSIDWADEQGNTFEILHWEFDGFSYQEIVDVKSQVEPIISSIDFEQAGHDLLKCKNSWHSLDFFAQSDWKCNFFGIPKERFKMVLWE